MERRDFLKAVVGGVVALGETCLTPLWVPAAERNQTDPHHASQSAISHQFAATRSYTEDYFKKLERFNQAHPADIHLSPTDHRLVPSVVARLQRLQVMVGHGNFQILGFDGALRLARHYPRVGHFPQREVDFLEQIFYADASRYGFYGEKILPKLSDTIPKRDVAKVGGNYLLKGEAVNKYRKIQYVIGDRLTLTSGVRGIMKQTLLFLEKALRTRGNLSMASRSLAPPGYSFHAIGDFDVGERGLGGRNFTSAFARTDVFKQLAAFGYIEIRYPRNNLYGVRFEPWHIKIASKDAAPARLSQNGRTAEPVQSFC